MRHAGNLPLSRRLLLASAAAALATAPALTFRQARAQAPAAAPAQAAVPLQKPRPARERLEEALARIFDANGEGARACLTVYGQTARNAADAADARAQAGIALGPLDGAIVSVKDLFDVAGEPTRAGSTVLA